MLGRKPSLEGADGEQLADRDQTTSDGDQTLADLDQTSSDRDQAGSESDQRSSDRDQEAADHDEATMQRAMANAGGVGEDDLQELGDALSDGRRARSQAALDRDTVTRARADTAHVRDAAGERRDRAAEERDAAARNRDALAAALDAELERLEHERPADNRDVGMDLLLRASRYRKKVAATRARAAAQREGAARDRELAAHDREAAALERRALAEELAAEGVDHLTGTLRRRVGIAAIQREIERTRRTHEELVLAFVDVDELKAVNDAQGHPAGDRLLAGVARCLSAALRPYDVVMRYGGDEFVCSLAGDDVQGVRDRFTTICERIAEATGGSTISVGLVERRNHETLEDLIRRADAAMYASRKGG